MRVVAVFHAEQIPLGGIHRFPPELGANPTMTMDGMRKIHALVPAIQKMGAFASMYCSRLARALDAASVLSLALNLDFQTLINLGQHANLDEHGTVHYPGHEGEGLAAWQNAAVEAVHEIQEFHDGHDQILIVSHRPIIGGLVAYSHGFRTKKEVTQIVGDPALTAKGYVVFDVIGQDISIVK